MVAPRQIRVKVVTVDSENGIVSGPSFRLAEPRRFRPSDLLPWADPYIAGLVRRLQNEVRSEIADKSSRPSRLPGAPVADVEVPWHEALTETEPLEREPIEAPAPGGSSGWDFDNGGGDRFLG